MDRRLVPNISHIEGPINLLLKKEIPQDLKPFGNPESESFKAFTEAILKVKVLKLRSKGLAYSFEIRETDYQVGAEIF